VDPAVLSSTTKRAFGLLAKTLALAEYDVDVSPRPLGTRTDAMHRTTCHCRLKMPGMTASLDREAKRYKAICGDHHHGFQPNPRD